MKIIPEKQADWEKSLQNNQDPYGACAHRYVERWAQMMEDGLARGEDFGPLAKKTSHEANTEGITVFMYGCAVSILSQVWVHGEQLRKWHNIDIQICNEGEKANESGRVLNPAILNICV